jgi:hypothetical protein
MGLVFCRRVPRVRVGYTRGGRRIGRARIRRARVDEFFFSKLYPIRLIPVPVASTQVRGYSGTGRRVRVRDFLLLFFKSNLK